MPNQRTLERMIWNRTMGTFSASNARPAVEVQAHESNASPFAKLRSLLRDDSPDIQPILDQWTIVINAAVDQLKQVYVSAHERNDTGTIARVQTAASAIHQIRDEGYALILNGKDNDAMLLLNKLERTMKRVASDE